MGWPPMKRGWSASATMAVFTPLTSVTTASARRGRRRPGAVCATLGHRGGRDGHEDDLRLGVVADRVDDACGQGLLGLRRSSASMPETCQPAPAQAEGDGPPDQPRPDDERPPARAAPQSGRSSRSPWAPWR